MALDGVLWILRTGAPWKDLPRRYGAYQTCHRRFQQWQRSGVLDSILWALCEDLMERGKLDLSQSLEDVTLKAPEHESEPRLSVFIKAKLQPGRSYLGREECSNGCGLVRLPALRAQVEPARLVPEREAGVG